MRKELLAAVIAAAVVPNAASAALIHVGACTGLACAPTEAGLVPGAVAGFPSVSFGPSTVGAFTVTGGANVTAGVNFSSQTLTVSTTTGGDIDIFFSGVGAQGQGVTTLTSSFTTNTQVATSASVTEKTWLDVTNTLFGTGALLGSASFAGTGLQVASNPIVIDTTNGLVEIGEEYLVSLSGGCSVAVPCSANMTIQVSAAQVPEPSSLALLGISLIALWSIFKWNAKHSGPQSA